MSKRTIAFTPSINPAVKVNLQFAHKFNRREENLDRDSILSERLLRCVTAP